MDRVQYHIYEQISENEYMTICRARRTMDARSVIVKKLKAKSPSMSEMTRFFKEYETIKNIETEGVVQTLDVLDQPDGVTLVLEDFQGTPLAQVLKTRRVELDEFLPMAIGLTDTLNELHDQSVIHGNITPRSILLIPERAEFKLTDFGIDALVTGSRSAIHNPSFIMNTLPYLSPEQTGRMNRSEDYRTDFYSLGVTLFEMITGITPFRSKDPLELIHCHIARPPVRPDIFVPDLPQPVCDIVMKLMAKAPEERYQSAYGLKADLTECVRRLTRTGSIEPFDIGKQDVPRRFIIPQKIYGREEELSVLLKSFEEVCTGENGLLLVTGASGIGKSALIYEIHKPIVATGGRFIAGKYEQYKTDSPYSAVLQAFKSLLRQILSDSEETIDVWRKNFNKILGGNGGVITEIFPELEHIVGKQPQPPQIGPEEARNRFNICFEDFVSIFVSDKRPLVLFLDDLQWADYASLNLLENLVLSPNIRHLLFILSYRNNEVGEDHPFTEMIRDVEAQGLKTRTIILGPLPYRNIGALVLDFLKCPAEKGMNLGFQIFKKTAGNPFFVNQFLKTLYDKGKIAFIPGKGWCWDEVEIASMQVTDNVVQLMADKIALLDENTQEILKISSCIGNRFDLETLSHVLEKNLFEVLTDLKTAIDEGYVRHVGDMYLYHHDRIQEAAYSLIPEEDRARYHLRIGRLLLEKTSDPQDLANKVFYITDQLNLCSDLIAAPAERRRLFHLNMESGKKAKTTAAFDPALKYFMAAENLIPPETLDSCDDDVLFVQQEIADTACLKGDYNLMNTYVAKVLSHSPSLARRVGICDIEIRAYFARQDYQTAITKSRELLKQLGISFPENVGWRHILVELFKVKRLLRGKDDATLLNLPPMSDEHQLAISKIYFEMGLSAHLTDINLYGFVALRRFAQILTYGNNSYSSLCFLGYGAFLAVGLTDINNAVRFGILAMKIAERPEGRAFLYRTHVLYGALIRHWKDPLELCRSASVQAYQLSREAGDQLYTGLALIYRDFVSFITTSHIPTLREQIINRLKITKKSGQRPMIQLHSMILQLMHLLPQDNPDPTRLSGDYFDEDAVVSEWVVTKNHTGLAHYYATRLILLYLTNRFDDAFTALKEANVYKQSVKTLITGQLITYFECLVLLGRYPGLSNRNKRKTLSFIKKVIKKCQAWSRYEPTKHMAWIYLIKAEMASATADDGKAQVYYENAADAFTHVPSPLFHSVALMRAASHYRSRKLIRPARLYMAEALSSFRQVGAFQFEIFYKKMWDETPGSCPIQSTERASNSGETLDLSTIMKSAQALSGEILLDKLLRTIMTISLESAGAQRGFLVLLYNGHLMIQAEGSIDRSDVTSLRFEPIENTRLLSIPVINYVARTKTAVVLDHACMDGEFVSDPYISENSVKSLLAAPMVSSGKLKGIIYLENNLSARVFSEERLKILDLLASQAAISLENARLFDDVKTAENKLRQFNQELEKRVGERTAALTNAYEQIKTMALTDPLTGLANRRMMMDRIKQEVLRFKRSQKPFALVIGDIDHFKVVNDTHGHDFGDFVLVALARLMTESLRAEDAVSRWGGEEFLFLLPDTDREGAMTAMEKIRKTICESPFQFSNITLSLSMTFGVSVFDGKIKDTEAYLKQADQALYKGKKSGRNRVILSE